MFDRIKSVSGLSSSLSIEELPEFMERRSVLVISGIVLVVGSVLDTWSTLSLLSEPGLKEANPVVAVLIQNGWIALLLFKAIVTVFIIGLFARKYSPVRAASLTALACGLVWLAAGVWNSLLLNGGVF